MTAKLVLDTRYKNKAGTYPIAIRIRGGNQLKHLPTGYKVPSTAWAKGEVKKNHPNATIINSGIADQLSKMKTKLINAQRDNITDLAVILGKAKPAALLSFSDYLESRAKQYDEAKKIKHARKVRRMLANLQECFESDVIPFELTADDMRKLDSYLKNVPNHTNTIFLKFRMLGQLFNNAIKERKTMAENVFENYQVPTKPIHKEKLTKTEIAAIESLTLPPGNINDSRNLFLFSYYCKGMRFEDCLRIKSEKIISDRIVFEEIRKGHKRITVKIHPKLKELIEPYLNNTPYLFPLLKNELLIDKTGLLTEQAERERIKKVESQNFIVNRNLKVIAAAAGITKNVSCHVSRHSFAYNLKKQGTNINVIKDALGHSDTRMTENYLKELEDELIDDEVNKLYD